MIKIAIVDDEELIRRGISYLLEEAKRSYQVVGMFENGQKALDFLMNYDVDVIITDIRMPVMDGLSFLQKLQQLGKKYQVIILSGYDDFAYAQQAIRFGVKEYLLKPINKDELYRAIDRNAAAKVESKERSVIAEVKEILEQEFDQPLDLNYLASRVYLTPKYLSKLFRTETGITIVGYLLSLRMEKAKKLLMENKELKSYEVAERVGYSDPVAFNKIFKKLVGMTPREYRERNAH
ncbi:MAG: response regulator [[Clostridium] leptum]